MKTPKRLQPLVEDGLIDEVIGRLMSGKEADIYMVRCGEAVRCAKVYKEAAKRGFKQAVHYQEGRKVRSGRRTRAMQKGSKFGRDQQEKIWQTAEVDALRRVSAAGVRVPKPYDLLEGVLLMELITDDAGDVAPRLSEVVMSEEQALEDHALMMHYVVLMLCAGLVHGDLSEFNVLVDDYGPVVIDLPQAVNAAANNQAEAFFLRDVDNMRRYYGQFAPELLQSQYGREIWALYESGDLHPDSPLTGQVEEDTRAANVGDVLAEIKAAFDEEQERLERLRDSQE
ncbi:PA4780 family RIO1-like protein kinase [Alloalcanivorax mobilis]|uniref:PA4780 family RIO1-like protein kinase n=1 Tax=Alloalcanivorax mobilis TaxID=2019569 RepID=UPI000B5B351C|nr:PA4780 family RIO1-like protein kinase [Alloalcanivorax mobilis]ASK33323.1 serine protein kinase RIO [Alcanivorax sp. N3-2A]